MVPRAASPSEYGFAAVPRKTGSPDARTATVRGTPQRTRTDRHVTQPSSFSNSLMSTVTTR